MSKLAALQRQRQSLEGAQLLCDAKGARSEADRMAVRIRDVDDRIAQEARHRAHSKDAATLMVIRAKRRGRFDAVARMAQRGQITAAQARACEALRDVIEMAHTGRSPMASMDVTSGGCGTMGLEVVADHVRRARAARSDAFDWIDRPRLRLACELVILSGLAMRGASERADWNPNGRGLRVMRETVVDSLERAAQHFRIAA